MEVGAIFYLHSFVSIATYFTYTKMGGTLPVLKNEIEDFFFARLGTGRTFTTVPLQRVYEWIQLKIYRRG